MRFSRGPQGKFNVPGDMRPPFSTRFPPPPRSAGRQGLIETTSNFDVFTGRVLFCHEELGDAFIMPKTIGIASAHTTPVSSVAFFAKFNSPATRPARIA